jgi:hypothetical protein
MSGGHFDYKQNEIGYIADEIESTIERNGREKTKRELDEYWFEPDWYTKYPEDKFHYKYPDDVIEKFKEAVNLLRKAQIYAHRIDWLLSGDDGEESFIKRLNDELDKIEIPLPNDALIEAAQRYKENVSAGAITSSSNGLTLSPSTISGICSTSTTTWKGGYVTNNFESYYMDENGNKHINNK